MLVVAGAIDDDAVERLFGVYAESIGDLSSGFTKEGCILYRLDL